MPASILLVAAFSPFVAKGPLLAIGHHRQPVGAHTQLDQIVPDGLGALFAQHEIVGQRAAFVAMAFDFH